MPKLHSKTISRRLLKTDNVSALDGIPPHGMDLRKDWKVPRTLPTFHGVENALTLALSGSNGIVILLYQKVNKMKFHIYTNSILKKNDDFNIRVMSWAISISIKEDDKEEASGDGAGGEEKEIVEE